MKRFALFTSLIVVVLAMAACGAAAPESASVQEAAGMPAVEMPAAAPQEARALDSDSTANAGVETGYSQQQQPTAADRKIIYTGYLSMIVSDPAQAMQQVEALVTEGGGYVANSQLSQFSGDLMQGNMVVRVPMGNYSSVMAALRLLGLRVLSESTNSEDVTAEFVDLEARLRNLEAAEKELLALLAEVRQRPNAKPADILEVYNAVSEKRGEIEQVKGRMQYLANLTALSTINVDLVPDQGTKPVVEEGWQPLVIVKDAARTLVSILQGLVDLLIRVLIIVVPVLLILAVPIVLLILLVRWLARRKRTTQ